MSQQPSLELCVQLPLSLKKAPFEALAVGFPKLLALDYQPALLETPP